MSRGIHDSVNNASPYHQRVRDESSRIQQRGSPEIINQPVGRETLNQTIQDVVNQVLETEPNNQAARMNQHNMQTNAHDTEIYYAKYDIPKDKIQIQVDKLIKERDEVKALRKIDPSSKGPFKNTKHFLYLQAVKARDNRQVVIDHGVSTEQRVAQGVN